MKKVLAFALILALALAMFAGCGGKGGETTNSDLAYVQGKGKLVVGITDFEPMDYRDENGEWIGFDAEFARLFAEKIGVEAEFIEIDWDSKLEELNAKSIDCIWNGMTITDELRAGTSVTDAYVRNAQVVVMESAKLAEYPDVESLAGLQFAVEAGSAGASAAKDNGLTAVSVNSQADALMEVASGSADACIIDLTMANAMTGEGTSYASLGYTIELSPEEYGVSFRTGSDLTAQFNTIMAELRADGTLQALADKYELTLA